MSTLSFRLEFDAKKSSISTFLYVSKLLTVSVALKTSINTEYSTSVLKHKNRVFWHYEATHRQKVPQIPAYES